MNGEYVLSIAKDKVLAADNTKNEYLTAYNSGVIKVDDQDRPTIASVQKVHASQYKVKFSEPVKSLTGANFSAKYVADGTTLSVGTTDAEDIVLDTTDWQLKGELLVNLNTAVKSNKEIELKLVGAVDWNNNLLSPNPASISLTKGESDGKASEVTDITVINPQKLEIKFSEEVVKFGTAAVTVSGNTVTKVEQDKNDKTKFIIELISPLSVGYGNVSIDADAIIDLSGEGIKAFSKAIQVKEDTEAPELTSAVIQKDGRDGYEYLVVKFNKDVYKNNNFSSRCIYQNSNNQ